MELSWLCVALFLCPWRMMQELWATEGYDKTWRKVNELLLFALYLYKIILPEVEPKGFNSADVRKIAMDSRAMQTNEYSKFVWSPLWI